MQGTIKDNRKAGNFPELMKDINSQIQETHQVPNRINRNKTTSKQTYSTDAGDKIYNAARKREIS